MLDMISNFIAGIQAGALGHKSFIHANLLRNNGEEVQMLFANFHLPPHRAGGFWYE